MSKVQRYPELPTEFKLLSELPQFKGDDKYAASPDGFIYGCKRGNEWRKFTVNKDSKGYARFMFTDRKYYPVHRIVALLFVPNTDNKPYINHKDGNRVNNHYSNLEWCTPSENIKHAYSDLNHPRMQGTKSPKAKLDDNKVRQIRVHLFMGLSHRAIGKMYGVSFTIISDIAKGKRWAHVI